MSLLDALAAVVRDLYDVGLLPLKIYRRVRWTRAERMAEVMRKWPDTEWRPVVRVGRHCVIAFREEESAR